MNHMTGVVIHPTKIPIVITTPIETKDLETTTTTINVKGHLDVISTCTSRDATTTILLLINTVLPLIITLGILILIFLQITIQIEEGVTATNITFRVIIHITKTTTPMDRVLTTINHILIITNGTITILEGRTTMRITTMNPQVSPGIHLLLLAGMILPMMIRSPRPLQVTNVPSKRMLMHR